MSLNKSRKNQQNQHTRHTRSKSHTMDFNRSTFVSMSLVLILSAIIAVQALRDVRVSVPTAVRRGDNALLLCRYDMEGDSLYSVKWYKGRREFYRYTPKENPAMKIFPVYGISINRGMSNESQLMLQSVQPAVTGKYSCEVSADAPSFHTMIFSGDLEVVQVPEHRPAITGLRPRYRIGDSLRCNCSSRHSKPAANLTWTINDLPAIPQHVKIHKPFRDHKKDDLESSVLGIQFVVNNQHFIGGKLKIRCTARIHEIYWQTTEKSVEEERPRVISAASSSNGVNLVQNMPYDQFGVQDNEITTGNIGNVNSEKKDTYMTHMQGDMSSSATDLYAKQSSYIIIITTIVLLLTSQLFLRRRFQLATMS